MDKKYTETHPSYGMLLFSRRSRPGKISLFGSSIKHSDVIAMTLKHGAMTRELNRDWYDGESVIAEVEMSYSQFVEAVSTMNCGDGIPCTVRFTEKDGYIEERQFVNKQEQYEQEFKEHLKELKEKAASTLEDVVSIFDTKKSIGKNDREEIIKKLENLVMNIGDNTEFIYKEFNEQIDKTVKEAKGEIEAFCQNKINTIAQAALLEKADDIRVLENNVEIN